MFPHQQTQLVSWPAHPKHACTIFPLLLTPHEARSVSNSSNMERGGFYPHQHIRLNLIICCTGVTAYYKRLGCTDEQLSAAMQAPSLMADATTEGDITRQGSVAAASGNNSIDIDAYRTSGSGYQESGGSSSFGMPSQTQVRHGWSFPISQHYRYVCVFAIRNCVLGIRHSQSVEFLPRYMLQG